MSTSADLTWLLVRNWHSRMVARPGRGGKALSAEPGNLAATHSFHNSGYIHPKVIDIQPAKGNKGIVVSTRRSSAPTGAVKKALIVSNLNSSNSSRKNSKAVRTIVQKYRPDLTTLAVARASGILRAQRSPKKGKAPRVRSAKAKAAAAKSA